MRLPGEQVTTAEVRDWRGVHLLHFAGSSCSQKVRILLAEKGIEWISHPVDLARHENTKPWFLGINPRGVVPVLVHDGVVHVESNDIMEYLDGALPSRAQPFFPRNDAERRIVKESLALEDGLHGDLRNLTMGFLVPRRLAQKPPAALASFEQGGPSDPRRDREIAWWRDFAERGIPPERARASCDAFADAFDALDKRLGSSRWLLGDRISVLEIAWFISVHRLTAAGYPMERHPRLRAHAERLRRRPAFAREVAPGRLLGAALAAYGLYRRLSRTTLRDTLGA